LAGRKASRSGPPCIYNLEEQDKKNMAIDLSSPSLPVREQRLGTIIAWDGPASRLVRESGYGKVCGGPGAKLCELYSPFTQGVSCSERIVMNRLGSVSGAVLVQHAPVGCSIGQVYCNNRYRNTLAAQGKTAENLHCLNTNLNESDMVFGGSAKLERTVRDAWERYHPKAIFIAASCATGIIGDDIDSAADRLGEDLGIPVIPLHCEGFASRHWSTGFDIAQHGILRQLVKRDLPKRDDMVNLICFLGSDIFTPMLGELGLKVRYIGDMTSVEDLEHLSDAAATISFCYTLSSYISAGLEEHFGVPELKAPQPFGFAGTDAWLRELGRITKREEKVEAYIAQEHARVKPRIEELKKQLAGVTGYVATGSAYAHGIISVLRELGVNVPAAVVFHHDPIYDSRDPRQDSLNFLVENYGDIDSFSVSNRQQYQFYGLLKRVKPDFLLIRHNGLAPLASRLGIPATPLADEHLAIAYQGIINLGELVLTLLRRKKFYQDLAAHSKLLYSRWWLEQDPYALSSPMREEEMVNA
jgi:nitrogenase molybdenum-iron protein alpha chain